MASAIMFVSLLVPSRIRSLPSSSSSSSLSYPFHSLRCISSPCTAFQVSNPGVTNIRRNPKQLICWAAECQFPDPIPEFAEQETKKFRTRMLNKLSTKEDIFGDSVAVVVFICTEIFRNFVHTRYRGPGTLYAIHFIDMSYTLNELGLPGGTEATRAAIEWARECVDKDWKEWTSNGGN